MGLKLGRFLLKSIQFYSLAKKMLVEIIRASLFPIVNLHFKYFYFQTIRKRLIKIVKHIFVAILLKISGIKDYPKA